MSHTIAVTLTLTLTSDLVFRMSVSRAHLLFDVGIPYLVPVRILGWWSGMCHLRVIMTLNLTSDLVLEYSCPELISYIISCSLPKLGV